jgi:hypothetical protein
MTGNTITGIALPNQRETSTPTDREFRRRLLDIAATAEAAFDLAGHAETADLQRVLERLSAKVSRLLTDATEAAVSADAIEHCALEDIEDELVRIGGSR